MFELISIFFLTDDDFNPRGASDDELEFNPRKSLAESTPTSPIQSFSTSPFPPTTQSTLPTATLIEPPRGAPILPPRDPMKISLPAVPSAAPAFNNNDKFHSDATLAGNNIFQTNPFEIPSNKSDPFGMAAFDNAATPFSKAFPSEDWGMAQKSVTMNTISLDELDPLKQ